MHVYSKQRGLKQLKEGVTLESYQAKYPDAIECTPPTEEDLFRYMSDGVCETPCECSTEPDGHCEHGRPSWLLVLGLI